MIIDITGIELTPGNVGRDCAGNGEHYTQDGELMECCCNECDFGLCCVEKHNMTECEVCDEFICPRNKVNKDAKTV